jgi:hypothetical protein
MRLHSVVCKLALLLGLSFFSDGLLSSKNLPRASCTRKLSSEFASLRAETTSNVSNRKQPKSPKRTSKVEPNPRSTAVFALMEGAKRKPTFAIRRLENDPDYLNLVDSRDRSFARLMLTTSERRQGQIDKVIRKFVNQSKKFRVRQGNLLVNQKDSAPDVSLTLACINFRIAQRTCYVKPHSELVLLSYSSWMCLHMLLCKRQWRCSECTQRLKFRTWTVDISFSDLATSTPLISRNSLHAVRLKSTLSMQFFDPSIGKDTGSWRRIPRYMIMWNPGWYKNGSTRTGTKLPKR